MLDSTLFYKFQHFHSFPDFLKFNVISQFPRTYNSTVGRDRKIVINSTCALFHAYMSRRLFYCLPYELFLTDLFMIISSLVSSPKWFVNISRTLLYKLCNVNQSNLLKQIFGTYLCFKFKQSHIINKVARRGKRLHSIHKFWMWEILIYINDHPINKKKHYVI